MRCLNALRYGSWVKQLSSVQLGENNGITTHVKVTGLCLRYNYIGNCVNKLYIAKVVLPFTTTSP